MSPKKSRRYGLLLSFAVFLLFFTLWSFEVLYRLEAAGRDTSFKFRRPRIPDESVLIVEIDDLSLRELGRWPWSRGTHGKLVRTLDRYGAKSVFFDLLFIEEDLLNPEEDWFFLESVREAGNVYIPYYFSFIPGSGTRVSEEQHFAASGIPFDEENEFYTTARVELPFGELLEAAAGTGFVNGFPAVDGVFRNAALFIESGERLYPAAALSMAARRLGADLRETDIKPGRSVTLYPEGSDPVRIPVNEYGEMIINYRNIFLDNGELVHGYDTYSYSEVLELDRLARDSDEAGDYLEGVISGRTVFIGMTATGSTDIAPTPVAEAYPMVLAHANIYDNIINSDFISYTPPAADILILLFLALILGYLLPRMSPFAGAVFAVLTVVIYLAANFAAFDYLNITFFIFYPVLMIILTELVLFIYKYLTEEKEKKRVRRVFSTYMTPAVVNRILMNPGALTLGGERREMTVFFSDLSGFTGISESLEPEALVSLINEYLEVMTEVIFRHEGTLDKYEGDAIMAFWNAPLEQEDHETRAVRAAIECFRELSRLQEKWRKEGLPELDMRIGINTGQMIVGNMGSLTRMDYTVMGDAVNLGARLESANKAYGTRLMISEYTRQGLSDDILTRELDALRVKGKSHPVRVYEVIEEKTRVSGDMMRLLPLYSKALGLYRKRDFKSAAEIFGSALEVIPGDGPSRVYLERCRKYEVEPPRQDWDGTWELTSK